MGTMTYYLMGILALSVVALDMAFAGQGRRLWRRLSLVAFISLGLVIAGLVLGSGQAAGFLLMGGGIVLAVLEILVRAWRQE